MKTPETSSLFEKRVDPESGVVHFLLSRKLAEHQQGFYFCNDCMTKDGRYLWFYICMQNPSNRLLAVVDFEKDDMYLMTDTLNTYASPYIDTESGDAYFFLDNTIYRRGPRREDKAHAIAHLPTKSRIVHPATHLTCTPDKKKFFLDVQETDGSFYVGILDVESGRFEKWSDSPFHINHGQLNPADPTLALAAYDNYTDPITGISYGIPSDEAGNYLRLWTLRSDGTRTTYPPLDGFATHEFWSADGKKIYYTDPWRGINRIHLETGEHKQIHACRAWHAFASADERYYVYDHKLTSEETFYRGGPAGVRFFNAKTGKDIAIVSALPPIGSRENPFDYHPDPHPRFVSGEKYVLFTAIEGGTMNVALTSTAQLLDLTR